MKKIIFILVACSISFITVRSQQPGAERLNSFRIGFFTKKLNLTPDEAEKFWPVFNEYQKQKLQIQEEKLKLMRYFNQGEATMSDAQVTELGDKLVALIVKESELAVLFHGKLKAVLPPIKVIRFYQAENQYKIQLLNELQNRQDNRSQQNRQFRNGPAGDL